MSSRSWGVIGRSCVAWHGYGRCPREAECRRLPPRRGGPRGARAMRRMRLTPPARALLRSRPPLGGREARERDPRAGERARKFIAREIAKFRLAQIGERVEAAELGIDVTRMAHDNAAAWHPSEKAREERGKVGAGIEVVDARKRRVRFQREGRGASAQPAAENAQRESLEVARQRPKGERTAALAHPRIRRRAFDCREHCVADLRK